METADKSAVIKVLDHGWVELVDHMGSDDTVVLYARQSTNKGLKAKEEDAEFLRALWARGHHTPFEFVEFVFHMKLPIFVARQIVRHRTASIVELSGRYAEPTFDFYDATDAQREGWKEWYYDRLREGMKKEQARMILPLSLYTQWYWKMDLRNLFHFLELRLDSHAQAENRAYAEAVLELIKPIVPVSVGAFLGDRQALERK